MIQPGDQALGFSLPDQDGREVKLADFRGQPVVVYFCPKVDAPGSRSSGLTPCMTSFQLRGRAGPAVASDALAFIQRQARGAGPFTCRRACDG